MLAGRRRRTVAVGRCAIFEFRVVTICKIKEFHR